jgi:hypothetical protein
MKIGLLNYTNPTRYQSNRFTIEGSENAERAAQDIDYKWLIRNYFYVLKLLSMLGKK